MTEKELKVLFENNSNCYTEVLTDDGEFEEMAITFDVFVRLVKILNIPVVVFSEAEVCKCLQCYPILVEGDRLVKRCIHCGKEHLQT